MVLVVTLYLRIRRKKNEGIEGNWALRVEEIRRRNPATIALAKFFFAYVSAGSNGFERIAELGLVGKAAFNYSRFCIFWIFFSNF